MTSALPQLGWVLALGIFTLSVLFLTKLPYDLMVRRGMAPIRAVYYTRKIVHMVGSGLPTLLVPVVFEDLYYPVLGGVLLGLFVLLTHVTDRRLHWFQIEDNKNDVTFALMWWVSLSVLWWLLGDPWLAILPGLFMSFGDGITGVVRNLLVKRRSKHVLGNVFMLLVSAPLGYWAASQADPALPGWGLIAAVAASIVERFELGPLDDNVLIALASTGLLLLGANLGPL
jgi:dolichol kinase